MSEHYPDYEPTERYVPPVFPPAKRRASRGWWLLAAVLGGGLWWALGSGGKGPAPAPSVPVVKVAPVVIQPVPVTLRAVGNVVAEESVAIKARLDSQIVAVHFKDGDTVKKGQLLFELDDQTLRAREGELAANIARDRAQMENAQRQSGRALSLAKEGFATHATRDDAVANAQSARAALSASMAALENVRVQRGYTRILAPISGRTGTINVTVGNTVKANDAQPLVTINQLQPIRVQMALPQQHFAAIRTAMQSGALAVTASSEGDATPSQGKLEYIDNAVDQDTGTFITRAGFANAQEKLLPGMFVSTVLILGQDTQAMTIPEVALQHGQTGDYVLVMVDEKAAKRPVKLARLQDGLAVIAEGLQAGEQVITDGIMGVKDGGAVKLAPAAASETAK